MARRVIIVGASGQLGRQLVRSFTDAGDEVIGLTRAELDLADPAIGERIASLEPEVVINAAAWTDVDGCARDPDRATLLNGVAPGRLAGGAARADALFVQISTNEVFDGTADRPYREGDLPHPINPYGASKAAGETAVAAAGGRHLIVRTAWLFGPGGTNFVTKILSAADRAVASGEPLKVVSDEWGNPTWTPDLADRIGDLVRAGTAGIVHAAGVPATSRLGWAEVVLVAAGVKVDVVPIHATEFRRASPPPLRAILLVRDDLFSSLDWRSSTSSYATALRTAIGAG